MSPGWRDSNVRNGAQTWFLSGGVRKNVVIRHVTIWSEKTQTHPSSGQRTKLLLVPPKSLTCPRDPTLKREGSIGDKVQEGQAFSL